MIPYAPRTSSLPSKSDTEISLNWSISTVTAKMYQQAIKVTPPLWSDDSDEDTDITLTARKSLTGIDSEQMQKLLIQLNKENAKLVLNPKSVIAANGSIQAGPETLFSLTNFYSNLAPVSKDDPAIVEFWNEFLLYDPISQLQKMPHLIVAKIKSASIPPHLRAEVWCKLCGIESLEKISRIYEKLLVQTSNSEKIIERDIGRTFPHSEMFKEDGGHGQQMLYRVLKVYSLYDPEVGYCQGLSFCVGPLLMQKMTEQEAFGVLVQIMGRRSNISSTFEADLDLNQSQSFIKKFNIRQLFTPDMSGLHLALFQLSLLIRTYIPHLNKHFVKCEIAVTMFASQWFLTLFSYCVPLQLIFRLYDLMLADGIMVTMMRISIALLKKNEEHILNQNELELILGCLKGQKLLEIYSDNYDSLIKDTIALSKHITTSLLDDIKDRYLEEEEKCAVAVTKRELEFMKSQIIELKSKLDKRDETIKELKSNNSLLDDKVLGQQQKLARIEKENAHLNAENIELRKLLHDHDLIVKQP